MTAGATRHFRIHGRVQGVGFRYWTQQEARQLGLDGWVRNCPDCTVEAVATGRDDLLDAFEQWLQHGPPGATVEKVESLVPGIGESRETSTSSAGFEILR